MIGSSWVKNLASYEGGLLGWVGLGHEPRVVGHVGSWVKHFDPFPTLAETTAKDSGCYFVSRDINTT